MCKVFKAILITMTALLCSLYQQNLKGDCDHSLSSPRNNLTPTARLVFTPRFFGDTTAVSFLGEIGQKLNRVNGTFGIALNNCNRFKVGAEFLNEKLSYSFFNGHTTRWMYQYAFGGAYQYVIDCGRFYTLDISARYSHAPSRGLSDFSCEENVILNRRIAGSNSWGVTGGFTVIPWNYATLNLAAVYDNVNYKIKYHNTSKKDNGVGGIIGFNQQLSPELFLNLKTEFRRPYRYYEGQLRWVSCLNCGILSIGIFGGRVEGRHDLPSSITGGIELGFDYGIGQDYSSSNNMCTASCCDVGCCENSCDFLAWMSVPAVYMPQVLAKADQRLDEFCIAPTSIEIPDQEFDVGEVFTINLASFFNGHGTNLTYSSNLDLNIDVGGGNVFIDPLSGQFYALGLTSGLLRVTVTATGACGSISRTFDILVNDDEIL